MQPMGLQSQEAVEWARRVNNRWIVHHGLKESANAYLSHIESVDQERLVKSCERARQLIRACGSSDDPKPWFYAGLFSLATLEEAREFLAGFEFTVSAIPSLADALASSAVPGVVSEETRQKIQRIRAAVAQLPD